MESEHIEISFMKFLPHQLIGDELMPAERAGRQTTSSPKTFARPGTCSGRDKAQVSWAYSEQSFVRESYSWIKSPLLTCHPFAPFLPNITSSKI